MHKPYSPALIWEAVAVGDMTIYILSSAEGTAETSFPSHEKDDELAASSGVRDKWSEVTQHTWCVFTAQTEVWDIQSHREPLCARSLPLLLLPSGDAGSLLADSLFTPPCAPRSSFYALHSLSVQSNAQAGHNSAHGRRLTLKTAICPRNPQCQKEMPEVTKALLFWQLSCPSPATMPCHDVSHLVKQTPNIHGGCSGLRDLTSMSGTQ